MLIKSFLLKLLCAIGVAALTVFVYSVTRSSAFAVLISGAVIGADFVFELRGGLRFLASSGSSLARYYPISIFNRCFDLVVVSVSAALIITILLFVFAFKVLCRIRNVGTPKAKINLPRLRIPKNRFTFELYKLNIKEKAALIIILALAVHAAVCFAAYIPDDSSTEYFYKKYSERFCGEVDCSKMADIQAEYNLQVYYSTLDIREIDESTSAEERDAINKNIVLSAYKLPAIEHVLSNARRVSTLSGAELIYDSGWNELFSSDFDYIFVLTAILITALFITRERESEAIYVVGTTRFGRRARITRQIAAVVITMTIFYIASSAISAAVFVSRYELPSGGALLKSLEYFSLADGLTINEYCIFAAVSIFVKVLFTVLLISGTALIIKRFYMSFAVCFAVVYIPFLAMKMNLEKINRFTVGGQLSFGLLMSASTDHPSTYLIVSTLIYCAICVLPLAYLAIRGKRDT